MNTAATTHQQQERINSRYARAGSAALALGILLLVATGTVLALATVDHVGTPNFWTEVGRGLTLVGLVVGVNIAGFGLLARKGRSIEEAYQLGYDLGYEKGHRHAARHAADLVVCRCGDPHCAQPAYDRAAH